MLINPGYKQGDVVTFKVVTGEEVIARFDSETLSDFVVNKPMTLVPGQQGNLGLVQSVMSIKASDHMKLSKATVILHGATRKEIADEYVRATSPIKPANAVPPLVV